MTKRLIAAIALACAFAAHAQTYVLSVPARSVFLNSVGAPCASCLLYTYAAGTTTPIATYTDSTGGTENTNPITLGADGGANVWLENGTSYKFVLEDSLGDTIWTVDNMVGGFDLYGTFCLLTGCTMTGPLVGTTASFSGAVAAGSFSGPGTGLTGTAAGLSIGGNAATATTATHAQNLPADFATQSAASAAAGTFTTMTATDVEGPVGSTTPAAGKFTTLRSTANAALAMPTGNISANTCTSPTLQAFSGVTSTSRFVTAFASDPSGVTGWGSTGGLVLELFPDATPANGFDWEVCNQTTSTINAGAITINVGVL